jgi:TolA-binding protein
MSWNVEEKLRKWKEERDNISAGFDSVKASYLNVATATPNDTNQLNFWDNQMVQMRERLSNLIIAIKETLEDVREKVGSVDDPIRELEKELEVLRKEEGNLNHKQKTREDQISSLESRGKPNNHTVGFLMMHSLANPEWMILVCCVTLIGGIGSLAYLGSTYLVNLGFTMPSFSRQEIQGRIITPLRFRMKK